jgi:hypothetical protein
MMVIWRPKAHNKHESLLKTNCDIIRNKPPILAFKKPKILT